MATKYAPRTQTAAVARAKSWVGKAKSKGWCQAWVVADIFGTGGVGDWDGDRAADAEDGWKKAVANGKVVRASSIKSLKDIPAGLAMYWSGGSSDNGHAAVSAGDGRIYSTDLPTTGKVGLVDATLPHTKWGLTFLGYVLVEGNGYTLTDKPKAAPKITKATGTWVVTAKALNGRDYPSTAGKILRTIEKGHGVTTVGHTDMGGVRWYITGNDTWYCGTYLGKPAPAKPPVTSPPAKKSREVTAFYKNCADYDHVHGAATASTRTKSLAAEAIHGMPEWIHLVELSAAQVAPMDELLVGYTRIGKGGKGRQSWRRSDVKHKILEEKLGLATPELEHDGKQYLATAWSDPDGYTGVSVVFHNENEGTSVQKGQLASVLKEALAMADRQDIDHANVFVAGDSNRPQAAADLAAAGWLEAGHAKTTKDMQYKSTNGWKYPTTVAPRIDVAAVGHGGEFNSAEQIRLKTATSDHNGFRFTYTVTKETA